MPVMSRVQATFCRSAPWRAVSGRMALPWSLQGFEPHGDVLEIGAGGGAMAAEVLARHRPSTMTVTDVDDAMVEAAAARLRGQGDHIRVERADAIALPFPDASFDVVLSWVMLHHTVEWERAMSESIRVLRPGGSLVGYDLLATRLLRLLHRRHGAGIRLMTVPELRKVVDGLPIDQAVLTPSVGGSVVRFMLRKAAAAT
jgi:ubiquinone/menaquinone biosynthesis C-methylase UbiE